MKLTGHTILITGGTGGIGFELAKQLGERGNRILITGRDEARLKAAQVKLPKVVTLQSDVADPKQIEALYARVAKEFPETNILINNAGIMREIDIQGHQAGLQDITREIETNLMGPIRMTQQFLPHLKSKSEAAIMNVSSGLAFVPLPTSPVYCATKAGLHSYSLSLRIQLRKTKVKVFELAPPATDTELLHAFPPEDMKGVPLMKVEEMVAVAMKGMENDRLEIRPGASNALKVMNRIAPNFILKQLSRPVERMISKH